MIQAVKRLIPFPIKQKIKSHLEARHRSRLFGDLAPLVPPVEDMFDGPRSLEVFKATGDEFLKIYKEVCNLRPDEKMLDVGCGIGRKTLPLTQYFTKEAIYEGIDITKAGVVWCGKKITPLYPNFRFQQINVYNQFYNPQGTYRPSDYKFPFDDETFDFVMLGSVFTHMLPDDLSNYLSEVHRVLAKGGRCLITYFLLNEESLRLIEAGKSTLDLKYKKGVYRAISEDVPELAIAFDESWIRDFYEKVGLRVARLDYGSWCGRSNYFSYQDLVLAVKE